MMTQPGLTIHPHKDLGCYVLVLSMCAYSYNITILLKISVIFSVYKSNITKQNK